MTATPATDPVAYHTSKRARTNPTHTHMHGLITNYYTQTLQA